MRYSPECLLRTEEYRCVPRGRAFLLGCHQGGCDLCKDHILCGEYGFSKQNRDKIEEDYARWKRERAANGESKDW